MELKKSDGSVMWCKVPRVEDKCVEDLVRWPRFFFHLQIQTPQSSCLSLPSGIAVARVFSHLALVQSVIFPSVGSYP